MIHSKISLFNMKHKSNNNRIRLLICFFIMFTFILNFMYFNNKFSKNPQFEYDSYTPIDLVTPESAAGLEIFEEPFKTNFDKIWTFFRSNYESNLTGDIKCYISEGTPLLMVEKQKDMDICYLVTLSEDN